MEDIEDIIAGIEDANIDPATKEGLLLQIQKEHGVVSEELTKRLIAIFDNEAREAEADSEASSELLTTMNDTPLGPRTEKGNSAAIVADISREQVSVFAEIDQMAQGMRADVQRMGQDSAKRAEKDSEAGNRQSVSDIHKSLRNPDPNLTN